MNQSPSHAGRRVLVVDDETHILQVLSLKLSNAGYTVLTAADGEEGLDVARVERPDLIITDFQMPFMTGLDMCRALASDERTARTPVLMLTARGYSLADEDLAVGNIRRLIHKPFSPRAVLGLVQQILSDPEESSLETDAA